MAIVTYDRLMAYKPHRLHFDEVLKNPQDKLAGSAYGFSRVDIKKGLPVPGIHPLPALSPGINTYPLIMGMRHFGKQKQVLRRKSVASSGCYSDSERKKRHEASGKEGLRWNGKL